LGLHKILELPPSENFPSLAAGGIFRPWNHASLARPPNGSAAIQRTGEQREFAMDEFLYQYRNDTASVTSWSGREIPNSAGDNRGPFHKRENRDSRFQGAVVVIAQTGEQFPPLPRPRSSGQKKDDRISAAALNTSDFSQA